MSMESCLTNVLTRQYAKLARLRSEARAAGAAPSVTPAERSMYQKQRAISKKQETDLLQKIKHDKQRIRTGGASCLSNPEKALVRHEKKLALHRQRTAAMISAFPPGV